MNTVTERVASGAALLDEHHPGWDQRISLAEFDIRSCRLCVLGQLFECEGMAGYEASVRSLKLTFEDQREHGFAATFNGGRLACDDWDDLQAEWERIITARRAAVPA